jgi:hypothetical protein
VLLCCQMAPLNERQKGVPSLCSQIGHIAKASLRAALTCLTTCRSVNQLFRAIPDSLFSHFHKMQVRITKNSASGLSSTYQDSLLLGKFCRESPGRLLMPRAMLRWVAMPSLRKTTKLQVGSRIPSRSVTKFGNNGFILCLGDAICRNVWHRVLEVLNKSRLRSTLGLYAI